MRALFHKIKAKMDRRAHVKRMMAGIECASRSSINSATVSKTFGLRALQDFERINGIKWDQKDFHHNYKLAGAGIYRHVIWAGDKYIKNMRKIIGAMEPFA